MTAARPREAWMDALRALCAFLVIVNHTNSGLFRLFTPSDAQWWLATLWYYASKLAVPVFVLVSGACLLPRVDAPRKAAWRALRVGVALVAASYVYFLYDAWVNWGLWPRMLRLDVLAQWIWSQSVTDSFWYLYFYIGLMLTLPFLQRLAQSLSKNETAWLVALCLLFGGAWPLAAHYLPGLALPGYLYVPLFTGYMGLFFAGHFIRRWLPPSRGLALGALILLVATLLANVALTYVEYGRVAPGDKYLFMDERTAPSLTIMLGAMALMALAKCTKQKQPGGRMTAALGGCAFGVYLAQDLAIQVSEKRVFEALMAHMPPFAAALLWEMAVYAACVAVVLVLRRVPGIKSVL